MAEQGAAHRTAISLEIQFRGSEINQQDLNNLERRWITLELARQMGLRRVSGDEAAQILNRKRVDDKYAGLLIPYIWPSETAARGNRIRRDRPDVEVKSDGTPKEKNKYLSGYGDPNLLYFVPGTHPAWLSDPTLPAVIVEGEFKAAALFRLARHGISPSDPRPRFLVIGLSGVWNWRGKVGKAPGPNGESLDMKGVIPDFNRITWTDRKVDIVYDANVRTHDDVRAARRSLTRELQGRGTKVYWVEIPDLEGVNGIDDLLARWQGDPVLQIIKDAKLAPTVGKQKLVTFNGEARGESPAPSTGSAARLLTTASSCQFELRSNGLYCKEPDEEEWKWIASPLEVLGETRDHRNQSWGLAIHLTDGDGVAHRLVLPNTLFAGDDIEVRKALLDAGCKIRGGKKYRDLLSRYLQTAQPGRRYRCVTKLGWYSDRFVLPDGEADLPRSEAVLFQPSYPIDQYLSVQGTLDQWRQNVGLMCSGNSRLILAVSAAFAGPLLTPLGIEGGGFHFVGKSTLGKSTALIVAGSVLGGGGKDGFIRSWKTTINALESTCEAHNDLTLMLDEIGLANPYDVVNSAYMIANGQGKARRDRTLQPRSISTWRLLVLSSGERTPEDIAASIGQPVPGGAIIRFLPLPGDAGCGQGLFEDIHSAISPKQFSDQIREASMKYYGSPLRAFLDRLTRDRPSIESRWPQFRDGFLSEYVPKKAGEEVGRAAQRFALSAYAGTLATEWEITGWGEDDADRAAGICLSVYLTRRGTLGASDVERGIVQVKITLEKYGYSRFELIASLQNGSTRSPTERVQERYGFRKECEDGSTQFFFLKEVFRGVVCKGLDYDAIANELARRGHLCRDGPNLCDKQTIPGIGRPRFYSINSSLLSGESQSTASDSPDGDDNSDPTRFRAKPDNIHQG